jgi:hypothetical protein
MIFITFGRLQLRVVAVCGTSFVKDFSQLSRVASAGWLRSLKGAGFPYSSFRWEPPNVIQCGLDQFLARSVVPPKLTIPL